MHPGEFCGLFFKTNDKIRGDFQAVVGGCHKVDTRYTQKERKIILQQIYTKENLMLFSSPDMLTI